MSEEITQEHGATIAQMSDAVLLTRAGGGPQKRNRPASIGHPCMTYLVNLRLLGLSPWSVDKLRLFAAGHGTERELIRQLTRSPFEDDNPGLGWVVRAQQGYVNVEGVQMWGRVEGVLDVPVQYTVNGKRFTPRFPGEHLFEVKALNPYAVGKLTPGETVEEAFQNDKFYCRYPAQGQYYMDAMRRKSMIWFVCPRGDHLNFVELRQELDPTIAALIRQKSNDIDAIVNAIEIQAADAEADGQPFSEEQRAAAAPAPEWIEQCDGCDFERTCWDMKPREDGEPVILDDPALEHDLDQLEELKPSFAEYNTIEKRVKPQIQGMENTRCGHWDIGGRWIKREKAYTVPPGQSWRRNIKRVEEAETQPPLHSEFTKIDKRAKARNEAAKP